MQARTKRRILTAASTAVVVIVVAGLAVLRDWPSAGAGSAPKATVPAVSASDVARDYLAAFAQGATSVAAELTDEPPAARRVLSDTRDSLRPDDVDTKLLRVLPARADADRTTGRVEISWTFSEQRVWTYENSITLVRYDTGWLVDWTPALVHPDLTGDTRLVPRNGNGTSAVLSRGGKPLLVWHYGEPQTADGVHDSVLLPGMAELAASKSDSGFSVALVDDSGTTVRTLFGTAPKEGEALASTVSMRVRGAAQAAVDSVSEPAMLVAIKPSTGDILAVAQNAALGTKPRSLTGLYPPGSTFKIATAGAALQHGLADVDTVLPCPGVTTIGERTIPNAGEFDLGEVPLRTAFAASCNTTFAHLAARLPADGLAGAATRLGLNASFVIPGITTELGTVEPAASRVQRVADGIGQGHVVASPLGVALMVATVASGHAVTPRLWSGLDTTVKSGYQAPPANVISALRVMMRAVVTSGTATELAGLGEVSGKTGTAEVAGSAAHGWFAGYRGDLAFATLIVGAGSSDPAVTLTGQFLRGL